MLAAQNITCRFRGTGPPGAVGRRPNPRCAKSVPRRAQTARHSIDTVDTNKPLTCAFGDALASLETPRTLWPGFTHQRSAVRYRPRPPMFVHVGVTPSST